jgi:monothiol glutaredoxin
MYETGELATTLGIVPPTDAPDDAPVAAEAGAPPLQIKNNLV